MLVSEVPGRLKLIGIESIFKSVESKDINTCTLSPIIIEEGEELLIELHATPFGENPVVLKVNLMSEDGIPDVRAWRVPSWTVAEAKILEFIR